MCHMQGPAAHQSPTYVNVFVDILYDYFSEVDTVRKMNCRLIF